MTTKPLLLVDFHNLAWRSAFSLKNADMEFDGRNTSILYGFVSQLLKVMDLYQTNRVIVCSDHAGGPARRKAVFPAYKAKRRASPSPKDSEFRERAEAGIAVAAAALKGHAGFTFRRAAGFEADDLIGAEVKGRYSKVSEDIIVVSSDADMYQLLRAGVSIHKPGGGGLYTLSMFRAEFAGIRPADWVYAKAIAGCPTDGVPGLRGVGINTAVKYLAGAPIRDPMKAAIEAWKESEEFLRNVTLVKLPMAGTPPSKGLNSTFGKDLWLQIASANRIRLPYPVIH